jgi:tetratricopeptide (TPR) repeat protein
MAAFNLGDVRTARVEFLNALQADPEDKAARVMQARVDLALGDGVAAESEILRARQSGVPAAETAHLLAHAKLLQGDARAALAEAAGAAREHEAYAARIRGRAYMALGDGGNALAAFNRALAVAPEDGSVWTDVARFRRSNGDVAGALEAADRAVAARPRDAEALVMRGLLTRGQYGLAASLPWFDRALQVDGGNVEALIERAITYGDMGRMSDMLADAREAHRLTGGHPTAYYLEAVLAARARNFALARSLWDRTNGAFDDAPAGRLLLSAIDFETGNEEQAARRLAGLVADQPRNRRARRLLAAAQWRRGDAAAVVVTLRPIADLPDADSYSLSLMGRALIRLGDGGSAALYLARAARPQPGALASLDPLSEGDFAAVRRAAEESPGDGPAQVRLVSALLARGQSDEALARARRLQAANPGVPEVHILVGDALGVRGDVAAAAEQYRRAANLAFTENVAMRLIEALQRSNQIEAADNVLNLFVQQNPRSIPGLILLGGREMQRGNWLFAIAIYEGLRARIGNNDATILNNLAWAYSESGDVERALPLARRAWALDRDNPATADTLGWLLFKSGRRAEGLVLLERAARGAPSDSVIRQRLASARRG